MKSDQNKYIIFGRKPIGNKRFKKLRYLVPNEFESWLRSKAGRCMFTTTWTETAKQYGIFFDLSHVEWVDPNTVVQLVLLIESALLEEIKVTVALPLRRARISEERWIHNTSIKNAQEIIRTKVNNRILTSGFLDYLKFREALQHEHLGGSLKFLKIYDDFDSSEETYEGEIDWKEELYINKKPERIQTEYPYKFYFPLTWIHAKLPYENQETTKFLIKFLSHILSKTARGGLASLDAEAISNIIFYELVDNVKKHATKTSWALITARVESERVRLKLNNYLSSEHEFIYWISQTSTPFIEITVGDSGLGIPKVLTKTYKEALNSGEEVPVDFPKEKQNIILWAFDRWSSSLDRSVLRGTRGLYRIDRIVKEYNGIITARSENQDVGWDHGGPAFDKPFYYDKKLSYFPGTVINLRIPLFYEESIPWRLPDIKPEQPRFEILTFRSISKMGMSSNDSELLKKILLRARTDKPICIIISIKESKYEKGSLEAILKQAAEMRHPGVIILCGLTGGWVAINDAVDSFNSEHEKDLESLHLKKFKVWDPILILGEGGKFSWAGTTPACRNVLNKLLKKGGILSSVMLNKLLPDLKERTYVIKKLRDDTNLVKFLKDDEIALRFTLSNISKEISKRLKDYVTKEINEDFEKIYRTPSLVLVKKWLDLQRTIDDVCGSEIVSLALSILVREHVTWENLKLLNVILADSMANRENVESLRKYLGVEKKEIMSGEEEAIIPPGVNILVKESRVLIYCDIICSSETVNRCLRRVLRDEAIPIAVVSMFDARENKTSTIDMWGTKVPVIPLVKIDLLADSSSRKKTININPVSRQNETNRSYSLKNEYRIKQSLLHNLIKRNEALHFNHIGRPIGRHFSLYLDATNLVKEKEIRSAFDSEISNWIDQNNIKDKIELWYPEPEPKPSAPARSISEWLFKYCKKVKNIKVIRRETAYGRWSFSVDHVYQLTCDNVCIIDWGALTGTSVMQMIRLAGRAGAKNVLACVFLSQLSLEEEAFLTSIESIFMQSMAEFQKNLPLFDLKTNSSKQKTKVAVSIRFLTRFPIYAYRPYECPLCQQLIRLSKEVYPTKQLEDFAKKQKDRLRPQKREAIIGSPSQDLNGQRLESEATIWMQNFRDELDEALISTDRRQTIFEKLDIFWESLRQNSAIPSNEIIWMLKFLSVETHWLKRLPLYIQKIRNLMAKISLSITLNDHVEERDRLNAIIVLRTSSKYIFAQEVANIFRKVVFQDQLLDQLLYNIFTYISRPYHQSTEVLAPLERGIDEILDLIFNKKIIVNEKALHTINTLESRIQKAIAKVDIKKLTPVQAWFRLKREIKKYFYVDDSIDQQFLLLRAGLFTKSIENAIADVSRGIEPDESILDEAIWRWLRDLNLYWKDCRNFLDNILFPYFIPLEKILESKEAKKVLEPDTVSRLLDLSKSDATLDESDFSKLVEKLTKTPMIILSKQNWDKYNAELDWYWKIIFRFEENSRNSKLISFLESAPAGIGEALRIVIDNIKREHNWFQIKDKSGILEKNPKVFCTEHLLRNTLNQVLGNIIKHRINDDVHPEVSIGLNEIDHKILVKIKNNLTQLKPNGGSGIIELNTELIPFQSEIRVNTRPSDGWSTFSAELLFEKGD